MYHAISKFELCHCYWFNVVWHTCILFHWEYNPFVIFVSVYYDSGFILVWGIKRGKNSNYLCRVVFPVSHLASRTGYSTTQHTKPWLCSRQLMARLISTRCAGRLQEPDCPLYPPAMLMHDSKDQTDTHLPPMDGAKDEILQWIPNKMSMWNYIPLVNNVDQNVLAAI